MRGKDVFRIVAVIALVGMCLSEFAHAEQREALVSFAPKNWERIQVPPGFNYDKAYRSSSGGFVILSKVGKLPPGQNMQQWVADEARALKQSGMQILTGPKEVLLGTFNWITIESLVENIKMEQYFADSKNNTMVSVLVNGDKNVFGNAQRQEINEYLSSFKLVPEDSVRQGAEREQVNAELRQKSVPAKASDVIGEWDMCYQTVHPSLKAQAEWSPFFADNQFFRFFEDGHVSNITSTPKLDPKEMQMMIDAMPKNTTYKFIADGVLEINRSPIDHDNIMISVITADMAIPMQEGAPLLKKGDLILSYLDPNKQLYMQRYLRKRDK